MAAVGLSSLPPNMPAQSANQPHRGQAADDVGEPVQVEEHAAGGDRDGDSDGEPDQHCRGRRCSVLPRMSAAAA
jgi:hypothetical protein